MRVFLTVFVLSVLTLGGFQPAVAQDDGNMAPSLYDRLGGLMGISAAVDDFMNVIEADEVMNANPDINAARKRVPLAYLKYHVTSMVCQATGGPCQYFGRGMKESHAHLNITEKEWDHMVELFKQVMTKHKVPEAELGELLEIMGSTKGEIVKPKG